MTYMLMTFKSIACPVLAQGEVIVYVKYDIVSSEDDYIQWSGLEYAYCVHYNTWLNMKHGSCE